MASRVCHSWRSAITGDSKLYRRLLVDLASPLAVGKAEWWCQRSSRSLKQLKLFITAQHDATEDEEAESIARVQGVFAAVQHHDGGQSIDTIGIYAMLADGHAAYHAIIATLESLALAPAIHDFSLTIYCQWYFPLEISRRFFGFLGRTRHLQFCVKPVGDDFVLQELIPASETTDYNRVVPVLGRQDVLYGGPRSLPAMEHLERLDFSGVVFDYKLELPDLPHLRSLKLDYCRLGRAFYQLLEAASQLERLVVHNMVQDVNSQMFDADEELEAEPDPIEMPRLRQLDLYGELTPCFWAPETDEQAADMAPRPEVSMPALRVARLVDIGTLDQEEDEMFKYAMETKRAAVGRRWRRKDLCLRMSEHEPDEADELMLEMEDDDWIEPGMDALYRLLTTSGQHLTQLVLDGSIIDDTSLLDSLRDMPLVEQLRLRGTRIGGDHLAHICYELTNLSLLDVRDCPRVCTHHVATASGAAIARTPPGPRLNQIYISDPGPYAWGIDPLESEFHYYERLAWQWLTWRGVLVDWESDGRRKRGKTPWTQPMRPSHWSDSPSAKQAAQALRAMIRRR